VTKGESGGAGLRNYEEVILDDPTVKLVRLLARRKLLEVSSALATTGAWLGNQQEDVVQHPNPVGLEVMSAAR